MCSQEDSKWVELGPGGQVPYLLRVRSSKLKAKCYLGVFRRGNVRERLRGASGFFQVRESWSVGEQRGFLLSAFCFLLCVLCSGEADGRYGSVICEQMEQEQACREKQ